MLDDDKRDVRLFQEAFLEDGDLHSEGGGRQRLFRWKNSGMNPTCVTTPGPLEPDQTCKEKRVWRRKKERQRAPGVDKMGVDEDSQFLQMGRSLLAKMNSNGKMKPPQVQNPPPSSIATSKSSSKAFLNALKGKSGSFLARRSISMSRVVALTSSEGAEGCTVNVSSRNFVFTSISPGTNKMQPAESNQEEASPQSEPTNKKKRPMKSKPAGAQPQLKKKKVASSLFQLL
ncbi:hypothetical protein B566_EDAN011831 [Ephemera danica]|nr:hypothetical protein B566_EDAN011831 [Ephemera danica]